nr:phage tail tape measure protein [Faecalibaculum rodentium]
MAYDIGPRISLKGEAEFKRSISSINDELKEYGSELKKVRSETEGQEKSTETLAKENEVLQKQLDAQTRKLDVYRAQLEKLTKRQQEQKKSLESARKEFGENSKEAQKAQRQYDATESEIRKLNQAINETETYCNNAKKAIKDNTDEMEKMGDSYQKTIDKISGMGTKTKEFGKKASVVSAGIVGIGVASQKAWSELDEAYDGIAAGTGATGEALESLQASFDKVYGNFPAESADVGQAIADLNTRFGFTGDQLEDCTEEFLKFSQVNGTDVSSAVALVSRAMGDAGIKSSDYAKVLDSLTAASQASGLSVDKLAESITKYGAPMRNLGFTMEESIALFSQWEKAGVNTEIAFSGMKKAISNWGKEGKDATQEFRKTLQAIQEAPSIADATSLAIEAFGSKAGPDLADAIKGGRFSIEEMMQTVENAGGIVNQTFGDMQDPADKATVAMNNLKLAGADLASEIQATLAPILELLVELLQGLVQWFRELPEPVKQMIVVIGGLVAALGPVIYVIGSIMEKASWIGKAIKAAGPLLTGLQGVVGTVIAFIKTAVSGLFTLIMAHPVIAVITAIIAAVMLLYTKCEWFRDAVNAILKAIWDVITEICRGMVEWFTKTLPQSINSFVQSWNDGWAKVGKWFSDTWNNMLQTLQQMGGRISQSVQGIWKSITGTFSGMWNSATKWGKDLIDGFISGIQSMWNALKNKVNGVAKLISNFLHFSVPEEGPLNDFDESGGDMMDLLIEGMESRKKALRKSLEGIAESMRAENNFVLGGGGELTVNMPVYLDSRKIHQGQNKVAISNADANKLAKGGW